MKHRSLLHHHMCGCALALCATATSLLAQVSATTVSDMREIKVDKAGGFYEPNRAPLLPTAFLKLPIGSITPKGWLRGQLDADANGMVGHMWEVSDHINFENSGWVHPEKPEGWEELTYWLRGYGDLAYVLKDETMIATARKWVEGTMATQNADGYFGPNKLKPILGNDKLPDPWAHMPMLHALRSYYEYSRDPKVLACMVKYFKWLDTQPVKYFGTGWAASRWSDTLSCTHWLYNVTGDEWLLGLSTKIQENSGNFTKPLGRSYHNVNVAQGIRQPAQYWLQSHDAQLKNLTEQHYQNIRGTYGQFAGGGFAGDENTREGYGDPRQGIETCGIAEMMLTFETMTKISSDPVWADRNEEITFNTLPAALTPDHRGLHYITSANCIQLDSEPDLHQQFDNSPWPMQSFKHGAHDYRCCTHNYGMAWPYYAEELWLGTFDNGLLASLYAASDVTAKVGDGTVVTIAEETDYPFSDTVSFKLTTAKPVKFPLYLRVPGWADGATLKVNGTPAEVKAEPSSYVVINRTWNQGDVITWQMPMKPAIHMWEKNKNAVSVNYGPLSFSLDLGENWIRDDQSEKGHPGTDAWPIWKVLPTAPWSYGLVVDAQKPEIEVIRKRGPLAANPFTPVTVPIEMRVKAKKIPNWKADQENVVTVLQQSPAKSTEPVETVKLIPMGAARLRISTFPTIGSGFDATDWVDNRPTFTLASSGGRGSNAVLVEADPKDSNDRDHAFFVFHKDKKSEWIQQEFYKTVTVSSTKVYWFDDHGGILTPLSWRLLYKEGGEWKPVANASAYGVQKNQYNTVTFDRVTTTGLRIEVAPQPEKTAGIQRWRIN